MRPDSQNASAEPVPIRKRILRNRNLALAIMGLLSGFLGWKSNYYAGLGIFLMLAWVWRRFLNIRWDPSTRKKFKRFRRIRRGYLSFIVIGVLWFASLFSELFINDRPLAIYYQGQLSFPTYGRVILGSEFGVTGPEGFEPVRYRDLDKRFEREKSGNWALMPLVPFNPKENHTYEGVLKPQPPGWTNQHYLGTDQTGRDILARLVYGFRIAIFFALAFMVLTYLIGIGLGCLMGYWGGAFDLIFQRMIEIWANIPFIYTVIIIFSVVPTEFDLGIRIAILLIIMVLFSWTGMTYYMRTATFKEKARDYTSAAHCHGSRFVPRHLPPYIAQHHFHTGDVYSLYHQRSHCRHYRPGLPGIRIASSHPQFRGTIETGTRQCHQCALDREFGILRSHIFARSRHLCRGRYPRSLRPQEIYPVQVVL